MKVLFAKGWKKAELQTDLFIQEKRVLKDYTKITLRVLLYLFWFTLSFEIQIQHFELFYAFWMYTFANASDHIDFG